MRDLTALLRQRPDLAGVYRPADFSVEAIHWSRLTFSSNTKQSTAAEGRVSGRTVSPACGA